MRTWLQSWTERRPSWRTDWTASPGQRLYKGWWRTRRITPRCSTSWLTNSRSKEHFVCLCWTCLVRATCRNRTAQAVSQAWRSSACWGENVREVCVRHGLALGFSSVGSSTSSISDCCPSSLPVWSLYLRINDGNLHREVSMPCETSDLDFFCIHGCFGHL